MSEKPKYIFIAHSILETHGGDLISSELDITEANDLESLSICFRDILEVGSDWEHRIIIYEDGVEVYNSDYYATPEIIPDHINNAIEKAEYEIKEGKRMTLKKWEHEKQERDMKEKKERLEQLKHEIEQLEKEVRKDG